MWKMVKFSKVLWQLFIQMDGGGSSWNEAVLWTREMIMPTVETRLEMAAQWETKGKKARAEWWRMEKDQHQIGNSITIDKERTIKKNKIKKKTCGPFSVLPLFSFFSRRKMIAACCPGTKHRWPPTCGHLSPSMHRQEQPVGLLLLAALFGSYIWFYMCSTHSICSMPDFEEKKDHSI